MLHFYAKSTRFLIFVFLLLFQHGVIEAQDIHFSQLNASPLLTNPAFNGLSEGKLRVISNSKLQWNSLGTNYRTFAFSADGQVLELNNSGALNIGGVLFTDKAGDLGYNTRSGSLVLGITQSLSDYRTNVLSAGFMTSYTSTGYDPNKIIAFDNEPLNNFDRLPNYVDFSLGIIWYNQINSFMNYYLGLAMYHINNPSLTVASNADEAGESLFRRNVINGGMVIGYDEEISIIPGFHFYSQGPHKEVLFGAHIRKNSDNSFSIPYGLGLYYRMDTNITSRFRSDAIIAKGYLDIKDFSIVFSYDINVSKLSSASNGRGGPELSLIYLRDRGRKRQLHCPIF